MSEQAYRRFMERYQRRIANRQPPKHDAWKDEPVLGREQEAGVLGLPLPQTEPDLADIVLDLLASADKPPLGGEAQALARAGRGGDSAIGHLTPGEIVIPQRLQTPEVMAALARASHVAGAPLQRMQVGHPANRINPKTGAPEFDDDTEVKYGDQDPSAGEADDFAGNGDLAGAGGIDPSTSANAPILVDGDPDNDITVTATPLPGPPPLQFPVPSGQIRGADSRGNGAYGTSRKNPDGTRRGHQGIDIVAGPGTQAVSPVSGTVTHVGQAYGDNDIKQNPGLKGLRSLQITDKNGYLTKLFYVDPSVKEGDVLTAGQTPIGTVQDLGAAYPGITNHVHLGAFFGGTPFNPTPYLPSSK